MVDKTRQPVEDAPTAPGRARYYRSLAEQLAPAGAGLEGQGEGEGEFPEGADLPMAMERRSLLKLLGASMALAGVGCSRDKQAKILPHVIPKEGTSPGAARVYATSMPLDGFATGLLVESHDGRPTKVEGNPAHPASLGATGVYEQASVLGLYDPHRARGIQRRGGPATWDALVTLFSRERADGGAGLRFLLEPSGSPLLGALIDRIREKLPDARFTFHAPARSAYPEEGARLAFGAKLQAQRDLRRADLILALDADFLGAMPFSSRYARQFAERRRASAPPHTMSDTMSRLYVIESALSVTGSMADHRLRARPSEVALLATSIAAELMLGLGLTLPGAPPGPTGAAATNLARALAPRRASPEHARFVQALARDLARCRGRALVIAGEHQPPVVHAVAHLINALVSAPDLAWMSAPTLLDGGPGGQDLEALAGDLRAGKVNTLIILEGNPVYDAPADLGLGALLRAVPTSLYLGQYENETSNASGWTVPAAHYLESWGDARAYDGTISLLQPLLLPLHGGRTPAEILALFLGDTRPDTRRLLRQHWAARHAGDDFERFFQRALQTGIIEGSEAKREAKALTPDAIAEALAKLPEAQRPLDGALEVAFRPDPSVYDGRFANNAWLLELPRPITKLTWDNAALLSPTTAARLGVTSDDLLEIAIDSRAIRIAALVVPGHADEAVTLHLGYGRRGAEALAAGVGVDVYPLRTTSAPFMASAASVRKIDGARHPLAVTQRHWTTDGRDIALAVDLEDYRRDPAFTAPKKGRPLSLYAEPKGVLANPSGEQWAMTIDTSICTGCNACVVACQAENNIPVVGKDQVQKSREMHWLRIDTYYEGPIEAPALVHQPMACQHCEKAPCEYVCPVNATVHSPDGLNEMIYNRCVGTRFCSNNCPYKVRRFNWFDWYERNEANQGRVKLQRNPEVTVRERGVMEKCTYCVQRIRKADIAAKIEGRPLREGEVITACAQACPTQAIQFDALGHAGSKMVAWRGEPRSYAVLHDLGTSPRTMYLARLRNPNPELA